MLILNTAFVLRIANYGARRGSIAKSTRSFLTLDRSAVHVIVSFKKPGDNVAFSCSYT